MLFFAYNMETKNPIIAVSSEQEMKYGLVVQISKSLSSTKIQKISQLLARILHLTTRNGLERYERIWVHNETG